MGAWTWLGLESEDCHVRHRQGKVREYTLHLYLGDGGHDSLALEARGDLLLGGFAVVLAEEHVAAERLLLLHIPHPNSPTTPQSTESTWRRRRDAVARTQEANLRLAVGLGDLASLDLGGLGLLGLGLLLGHGLRHEALHLLQPSAHASGNGMRHASTAPHPRHGKQGAGRPWGMMQYVPVACRTKSF